MRCLIVVNRAMAARGRYLLSTWLQPTRYLSTRTAASVTRDDGDVQLASASGSSLSGKAYGEVLRGWVVFKLLSYDWIVRKSLTVCVQ